MGRAVPIVAAATIDDDRTVPSWRRLVSEVHKLDCRYIIQLHFSGRQRDLARKELPSTISYGFQGSAQAAVAACERRR